MQQCVLRRRAEHSVCEAIAVIAVLKIGDTTAEGERLVYWSGWHRVSLHAVHQADAINRPLLPRLDGSLTTNSG